MAVVKAGVLRLSALGKKLFLQCAEDLLTHEDLELMEGGFLTEPG